MRRGLLAAAALLAPVAAVIDPLALAPLFALAALLAIVLDWRAVAAARRALALPALLLASLALWAAASALWSILPLHSFLEGLRFAAIAAGGLVLVAAARAPAADDARRIASAAAIGLALMAALLLIEAASGAALARLMLHRAVPLQRYDRAASVAALALWPALAGGMRRWRRLVLLLATGAAILLLDSTGAKLALVVGMAVFAVARLAPRFAAAAMVALLLALAVALPLATPSYDATLALHEKVPQIKWDGIHRLFIWRFTAGRVAERPLAGWGMDAARALPGGKTKIAALFPAARLPQDAELLPLHPHDAILEWEVELGVPGVVLALAAVSLAIVRTGFAPARAPGARAAALGWCAASLTVALLDYGAWQAWWLAAIALSGAPLSAAGGEIPPRNGDSRVRDRP